MQCLECEAENPEAGAKCHSCGESLIPARVQLHLERATAAVETARFALAANHLGAADAEMVKLGKGERHRRLFSARAFLVQGYIYYANGQVGEAKQELLLAADNLIQQNTGSALLANTLGRLGNISYYMGDADEATNFYARSAEVARAAGAHAVAARTLTNLGSIYIEQGEVARGKSSYDAALAEANLSSDTDTLAQVYRLLGWYHANFGPFTLALEYTEKMLGLPAEATSPAARAMISGEAANIYAWYGDLARAGSHANEAYNQAQQSGSEVAKEHAAIALSEMIRQGSGQEDWGAKALRVLAGRVRGAMMRREVALHLAICYIFAGDKAHIRRHLAVLNESLTNAANDERILALSAHALGLLYAAEGEWELAAQHFSAARERGRLTPYETAVLWQEYGEMLRQRAEVDKEAGWEYEASTAFATAAGIFRDLGLEGRAARLGK